MRLFLLAALFLAAVPLSASETLIRPGTTASPSAGNNMYLVTSDGKVVPAVVTYTSDGNGNLSPAGGGGGGGSSTGRTPVTFVRNVYSSTNVTTGAYVQLVASLSAAANELQIFDSSGQTLVIAYGGAGSEVDKFIIPPGGNGTVSVAIPISTRVSVKALSATASSGELDVSFLN